MRIVVRQEGKLITLREFKEEVLYLGRSKKNDVVLADSAVSRRHAKVFKVDQHLYVEDLKTINGTRLKGEKIRRTEIALGDTFQVGPFDITLEAVEESTEGEGPVVEDDAGTTFAEAPTDLAKGEKTLGRQEIKPPADDFMEAIAVRPRTIQAKTDDASPPLKNENLKVLKNFLKTEPTPADFMPMEKPARLVKLDGPATGQSIPIEKLETTLGKARENDIVVSDGEVSEAHAVIEKTDAGTYILKDRPNSPGTFVDGVPVRERELENHDIVQVGNDRFEFVEGPSRSRAEAPRVLERSASRGGLTKGILPKLTNWKILPVYGVVAAIIYIWATSPSDDSQTVGPGSPPPSTAQPAPQEDETVRVVQFLLEKARSSIAQKDFPDAEDKLSQILTRLDPNNVEAIGLFRQLKQLKIEAERPKQKPKELAEKKTTKPKKEIKKKEVQAPKKAAKDLKKIYQDGVVKFEAGDLKGAEPLLQEVAQAKGNPYQTSAKNILKDIRKNSASQIKDQIAAVKEAFDTEPVKAYSDLKPLLQQFPNDPSVKDLKEKIEKDLESRAKKSYSEGIAFQEVVEDIPSAMERFQETLRLSPDPKMKYHQKAQQKLRELQGSSE